MNIVGSTIVINSGFDGNFRNDMYMLNLDLERVHIQITPSSIMADYLELTLNSPHPDVIFQVGPSHDRLTTQINSTKALLLLRYQV